MCLGTLDIHYCHNTDYFDSLLMLGDQRRVMSAKNTVQTLFIFFLGVYNHYVVFLYCDIGCKE